MARVEGKVARVTGAGRDGVAVHYGGIDIPVNHFGSMAGVIGFTPDGGAIIDSAR